MAYDKTTDLKNIQADVLTTNINNNELIGSLKQLKTDNKSITKAINVLNEQLDNSAMSANDALQRVVELETRFAKLEAIINNNYVNNNEAQNNNEVQDNDNPHDDMSQQAKHVFGMILVTEGNRTGTWVRVDKDFNPVEFNPEHGTWAGMKQVMNDTYGEFVEIPVTYVKTETLADGPYAGKNCWWIADGPEDGFHVHPAFIGQDGQPHNLQIASWIASNKNGMPFSVDKGNKCDGYWNGITYETVHNKGWMTGGARPYNIYDHHFLARMMLTEFGTPDVQAQTVDHVSWDGNQRITYHGIHDPFGTPGYAEYYWLDGLTTLNDTYQVLAADGSRDMVETYVRRCGDYTLIANCRVNQINGIDFGDLFIAHAYNPSENSGSFADDQELYFGVAFEVCWGTHRGIGAFHLVAGPPSGSTSDHLGWRIALCS